MILKHKKPIAITESAKPTDDLACALASMVEWAEKAGHRDTPEIVKARHALAEHAK